MNNGIRILIVEDRIPDFDLAQREIRKSLSDCEFQRVETRDEYLTALEAFEPDLILSDYSLPNFNGIQALQLAKKQTALTPFIIWTGSISEDVAVECMKMGASNYVIKENLKRLGPAVVQALKERTAILERKRAEEKYRSIFENSPVGIFQSTPQGQFISVNPAMAQIYGYDSPQEMLSLVVDIPRQLYPDPEERGEFTRLLESREVVPNYEWKNRRKDGSIFWSSTSARIVHDAEGNVLYYEGFLQDITGSKEAQEKLRESEARYRGIFESAQDAIFVENADGDILEVNQRACEMFGYSHDEFLKKKVQDLVPSPDYFVRFEGDNSQPGKTIETVHVRANGEQFPVEISGGPYESGSHKLFLIILRDISERKRTEEELRSSQRKYQDLVETSHDLIWSVDAEGKITFLNRAAKEIYGYEPEELIGHSFLELMDPDRSNQDVEHFKKVIDPAQTFQGVESYVRNRDGRTIVLSANSIVMRDPHGNVIGVTGSSRDITKRKKAENELREVEERFSQLANHIEEVFWITDAQTEEEIYISPAAESVWGQPADYYMHTPNAFMDSILEEDRDFVRAALEKQRAGSKTEIEYRLRRADGSVRWIWDRAFPIFDEQGNVKRLAGIAADITERKLNQMAVLQSQARYYELFENSPVSLWEEDYSLVKERIGTLREQGFNDLEKYFAEHPNEVRDLLSLVRITDVNKATFRLLMLENKDELRKQLAQVFDPRTGEHFEEEILGLASPERGFVRESYQRRSDGSLLDVIVQGSLLPGNEDDWSKVIISITDITEQKKSEAALRASEAQFIGAFDFAPIGMALVSPEGRFLKVNHILCNILGYTKQELLTKTFQEITHPDDLENDLAYVRQLLAGEIISYQMEKRYIHKSGHNVWILLSGSLVRDSEDQPLYAIAQIQDITERRHADIQLQQKNEDLALINAVNEAVVHGRSLDATMELLAAELKRTFSTIGSTIYMFDSNKQSLIMQQYAFSPEVAHKIERLIGSAIPKIEIPIKEGGYFHRAMISKRSAITSDPLEIQNWIAEFVETRFLPSFAKAAIRKLIPQIYRLLNIKSTIVVPLISENEVIGLLDVSSSNMFTTSDLSRIDKIGGQLTALFQRQRANEELRRRAEETAALLKTSMAITTLDIKEILDSIGNSAKSLFSADGCRLFLIQPDGVSLKSVLALQDDPGSLMDITIKLGEGVTGNVALTGKPEIVNDMVHDPRAMHIPGTADNEEEAIMFAPLQERDRTIGVLSIRRAGSDHPFTPEDLEFLEAFAALAASAVSNARLFEEAQRRLSELEALYENGLAVGQLLEPRKIGERVIETFARYLSWHHVTIRLVHPDTDELELIAFNLPGLSDAEKTQLENHFSTVIQKIGQGLSGQAARSGIPLRTGDVHAYPEYVDTQAGIASGLYMPLKVGERVIGVISVESEVPDAFSEQDQRLLATLGSQAAIAFENARLYQAAQQELMERTRAQSALWASETHYRQLADSITDILFELDYDFRYTHWNKASEMFSGMPAAEIIGKSIQEVWGASEEPFKREEIYKSVIRDRQVKTFEIEAFARGKKHALEITIYPSMRGVSVVARDITERKLDEIILRKRFELMEYSAHHSLEEVMQNMLDEICELTESPIGFLHLVNPDEVTTHFQTWSTKTPKDFCEPDLTKHHSSLDQAGAWADAARQRKSIIHNDFESLPGKKELAEGHAPLAREMVTPIFRNDKIVALVGVGNKTDLYTSHDLELIERFADYAWDITERKQMANALAEERNQLARRVEERTSELSRANSNLARALRVKDEFLANMSHELRTPLNAILGLSESLGEQVAGPLNEKQQKYLNTINESGHHLLSLINDILDLAKIEAGHITLDINKVDINSVCQAGLRMIKQLAQKKNQEVTFEMDGDLGLMWADERRLKQMIVNLLSNAVKFTPDGGKVGLEVHGDEPGNRIMITVWDTGIGISERDIEKLFRPFVQLDTGLTREATGTGLGLALVAQMARLHGGSVNVESRVGEGSRFTIHLPWEPALAADASTRLRNTGKFRAIDPNAKDKPTILLIEDTREVVMMLADYLEMSGFKVVTAQDGVDGVQQAKLSHPNLILMDVMMPGMDGFETTQKLRADPQFKQTPIIALTALAMPNDRQRCLDAGMDEYISKPVNLRALVKLIRSILLSKEAARR